MKKLAIYILSLILVSCSASQENEVQNEREPVKVSNTMDSIGYVLSVDSSVYTDFDSIRFTLKWINESKTKKSIWLDAGTYPTGTDLKLLDSTSLPITIKHFAALSSNTYSADEAKQFHTQLESGGSFERTYRLASVIMVKPNKDILYSGRYQLRYADGVTVEFNLTR